jgi:hypothetical protein
MDLKTNISEKVGNRILGSKEFDFWDQIHQNPD